MPPTGAIRIEISATLADGSSAGGELARITAVERDFGLRSPSGSPRVAIAMATFDPAPELFRAQIESIRQQTMEDWICLISDDCTPPARADEMRSAIAGDERFIFSPGDRRLGFYRNFERALELVPADVPFVALADQDDRWYPEKLQELLDGLGNANLVYSDQRLVDPDGHVLADTYWTGRRNNHTNLASLLIANTITGAASLFRRDLLSLALPFPETPGTQYHDQWLGLVALSTGKIHYVDRPLYDYVQHGAAALGHTAANPRSPGARVTFSRIRKLQLRRFVSGWRAAYFFAYCRLRLLAETLLLRCGDRMDRRAARTLRRFVRSERSPFGISWLVLRGLRRWFGRNETLRGERILVDGILWRYIISAMAVGKRQPSDGPVYSRVVNASVDASLPLPETQAGTNVTAVENSTARDMARLTRPVELSVARGSPRRVNILIPTVELKHFFGGYIGKFNLARKLAQTGFRTRILTVDPTPPLPRGWREQVESYAGLEGLFEEVEIAFARDHDAPVAVSPEDTFVATTWWTAHVANAAAQSLGRDRFLYLIQEYEPFTFPMGSWAALAMSSYEFPHVAMFSSELLREFFAVRSYGVFRDGRERGAESSISFQNAITAVAPPPEAEVAARSRRRLLFYARPEGHGSRNMFELGLLGLSEAIGSGVFDGSWSFIGIGSVEGGDRIQIGPDHHLELLKRSDQAAYAAMLPQHDVGLSLMCTPHPSLVPIEMASAGLITVTNSFETKTPEAMSAISENLLTVEPSLDGIVSGLSKAVELSNDAARRVRGAQVNWSRDWDRSLDSRVMQSVAELLARC